MEYRVIRVQEEERKRLARDLHDGLAQLLVGMSLNLELLERVAGPAPAEPHDAAAAGIVARLREQTAGCLAEVRRILTDLRPLDMEGKSLSRALKDYAERFSLATALRITVVISGREARLPVPVETGLFRIFQEALNNARDHSGAREVALKLRFLPRLVSMDISDDGRGFSFDGDFGRLAESRCFGLIGMRERAQLLGGTWRLHGRPGEGTAIRVRLPVPSSGGLKSFISGQVGSGAARGPGRRAAPPVRVLIADDHAVVREGLKMILETATTVVVVGEAGHGEEAVRLSRELSPDVVLLDLVMPGPGPAEVIRALSRNCPKTVVLALTAHHDPEQVRALLAAGAGGYLLKTADGGELVSAVQAAAAGVGPLDLTALKALSESGPEAAGRAAVPEGPRPYAGGTEANAETGRDLFADLTLRERDIVVCVGRGMSNADIARKLFISEKTVRNHTGAILRKLGLGNRTQLALAARGLMGGPGVRE